MNYPDCVNGAPCGFCGPGFLFQRFYKHGEEHGWGFYFQKEATPLTPDEWRKSNYFEQWINSEFYKDFVKNSNTTK